MIEREWIWQVSSNDQDSLPRFPDIDIGVDV